MKPSPSVLLGMALIACLAGLVAGGAQAASAYSQKWSGGGFAGSQRKVLFDLQLNVGKFDNVWLRYRYQDFAFNGWRHAMSGPFDRYGI